MGASGKLSSPHREIAFVSLLSFRIKQREKSAEVFVAPTNQFVDGEVSHTPDLVEGKHVENSKR